MTARGAADFLTRSTAVLGGLFIILSIPLAAIAGTARQPTKVDTSLANQVAPASRNCAGDPAAAAAAAGGPEPRTKDAPAVPLAQ